MIEKITIERYGERQKREYPKRPGGSHDLRKPFSWMIKIVCFDGEEQEERFENIFVVLDVIRFDRL